MQLIEHILPDSHNILFFGDEHKGSALHSKRGWAELVDMMHSKIDGCRNNYGVDGGDPMEAITVDDKRYGPEMLTQARPLQQFDDCVADRQKIKGQMLAMLSGNHDDKLWKFGDLVSMMCDKLGVPYGTSSCKISVKDKQGNLMYKVFEMHGNRTIRSTADDPKRVKANMELILKRQLRHKAGDCAVMIKHHAHRLIVSDPNYELYLTDDGQEIQQNYTAWGQNEPYIHPDARWYGCAGSFVKMYELGMSGYAEKAEYDPTELGWLLLKVRDRKIVSLEPHYVRG